MRTDGEPSPPERVDDPSELRWSVAGSAWSITSVTPATCGDAETAAQYGMPRMLRVDGTILGSRNTLLLGLEPEPYDYQTGGLHATYDITAAPEGWEFLPRDQVVPGVEGPPRLVQSDVFLRRLDKPDEMFRYYGAYCDQEDGSPTGVTSAPIPATRLDGEPFVIPQDAPIVMEHADGDYVSLEDALDNPSLSPATTEVVVAELGRDLDLEFLGDLKWNYPVANEGQIMWFVVLRLTKVGPVRPGDQYGMQVVIKASSDLRASTACCMRLVGP